MKDTVLQCLSALELQTDMVFVVWAFLVCLGFFVWLGFWFVVFFIFVLRFFW